jgi:para-aminobenzoate synthetase/4-amino-4-deoxychorismate lyase
VGSVSVPELFAVERYPTVWQMTSRVTGRSLAPLQEVFAAMHPSASVTGAPKVRTMEIIRELESHPRGVYTGAIGHVWPNGNATFNVAIRTAVVDRRSGTVRFGVGSGIVWDSDPDAEYDECLLKGAVLGGGVVPFALLETLRWSPGEGFFLLDRHLARLAESAEYFDRRLDLDAVRDALTAAVDGCRDRQRIRLLVDQHGAVRVERTTLVPVNRTLTATLAREPIDTASPFVFHKTTKRDVYERLRQTGVDETILWNGEGQVTEAIAANIVAEIGGRKLTPPVECGLLAGTFRAHLLARGEIVEDVISVEALRSASRLWLINSVHERRPVVLTS